MVTHGIREALVAAGNFPELLTADQVSALLGVSAATLNRWAAIRETTGEQIGPQPGGIQLPAPGEKRQEADKGRHLRGLGAGAAGRSRQQPVKLCTKARQDLNDHR